MSINSSSYKNKRGQPIGEPITQWTAPNHIGVPAISGNHIVLERLATSHTTDLYQAFSKEIDDATWTYLPYGPFTSKAQFQEWLIPFSQSEDPWMFALIDKDTGKASGVASYLRINPNAGSVEVGHIHYAKRLKKTRAATEVMYLMAEHAFNLGYRRYEWKCDSLNRSSKSAAKRLGFTFEGVFRQATIYKQRNRDTAWFSLLDTEWQRQQDVFQRWLSDDNFDSQGYQKTSLSSLR